jgi:glutaredoxin-like protein NrdH
LNQLWSLQSFKRKRSMSSSSKIILYALSTCVWCKKTKRLLNSLGVKYQSIDVDLLPEDEEAAASDAANDWSNDGSYPVIVINNKKAICGYNEDEIRREFE